MVITAQNIIQKPGYKQTEVGMIPENWKVKKLEELGVWKGGGTPSMTNASYWIDGTIYWASSGDIKTKILSKTASTITEMAVKQSSTTLLQEGAVLIVTRSGILRKYLPVAKNTVPIAINQDIKALIPNSQISADYLLQVLSERGSDILSTCMKAGTTVESIEYSWLKKYQIPVPSPLEQQAIANALSDVDALITSLDRLIAKKHDIKQAAMQQFLTGKMRLPGFSGEWQSLNMADNSTLKARIGWQGLTTAEYLREGEHYLVTGTDFIDGKIDWDTCHFVDAKRYNQDKNIQLRAGDILLTKDGTIGKVAYINQLPGKATLNSGVFVIRPNNDRFYSLYLYYVLSSSIFDIFLKQLKAGSTISHLYQRDIVGFSFLTPSWEEQQAIAIILSDMDAEIAALEQKRDKIRALKQGMMQELLTGKTRLV